MGKEESRTLVWMEGRAWPTPKVLLQQYAVEQWHFSCGVCFYKATVFDTGGDALSAQELERVFAVLRRALDYGTLFEIDGDLPSRTFNRCDLEPAHGSCPLTIISDMRRTSRSSA